MNQICQTTGCHHIMKDHGTHRCFGRIEKDEPCKCIRFTVSSRSPEFPLANGSLVAASEEGYGVMLWFQLTNDIWISEYGRTARTEHLELSKVIIDSAELTDEDMYNDE